MLRLFLASSVTRAMFVLVLPLVVSASFSCGPKPSARTANGGIPPEIVQRIVRSRYWVFQRCYEDGLKRDPMLHGRVVVHLTVGPEGRVTEVHRDPATTIEDSIVIDCILADYKKMRFPKPERGTDDIVYPLAFTAPGAPPDPAAPSDDPPIAGRRKSESAPPYPKMGPSLGDSKGRVPTDYDAFPNLPEYPCPPPSYGERFEGGTQSDGGIAVSRDPPDGGDARLPPELIQARIRESYEALRDCYAKGIRRDWRLAGKVTVQFMIGREGRVIEAMPVCTSLHDRDVVSCMVDVFKSLRFPRPEGGIVTVNYPIMFSPGD